MTRDTIRPIGALDELRQILPTEQIESHGQESGSGSYAVEPVKAKRAHGAALVGQRAWRFGVHTTAA